jgi:hypothetical protein
MRPIDPRTLVAWRLFALCGLAAVLVLISPGCKPKALQALLEPSQALSSVLAEEAVRVAGTKKQVALITPDASWGPASTVEESLKAALKKHGVTVVIAKAADVGNPMFSGQVGLKAKDFLEALEKSAGAGAGISLAGAPLLKADEAGRLSPDHPPVLVGATAMQGTKMGLRSDPVVLAGLLEAKVIQLAIIDGADPTATLVIKGDATREIFARHYRILRRPD